MKPTYERFGRQPLTIAGETATVAEWCRRKGLTLVCVYTRVRDYGRSIEEAVLEPPRKRRSSEDADELFPGSELSADQVEFAAAVAAYQKRFGVRYPRHDEILYVAHQLGYRKVG